MGVRQVIEMAERFDAIIVVHQRTQFLQKLLGALRDTPGLGRLIVVDNGNDDQASAEIKHASEDAAAMLVALDNNLNYGEALNKAMFETSAPAILIAHSDSIPAAGCLEAMLGEVGVHDAVMPYTNRSHVPGAVIGLDGREYRTTPAAKSRVVATTLASDVISGVTVPTESAAVDSVDTFFLLVRREVALSLGPFDESIFHRDPRMDDMWWRSAGRKRFSAAVAGGAFCFHYGGFTIGSMFPDGVVTRTNDLILSEISDNKKYDSMDVSDDLRNSVLRLDAEINRASAGPVFGKPIHLIHVGKPKSLDLDRLQGIFESHSVVMPEDDQSVYDSAIQDCQAPWIMVLKSGERFHPAALPGVKRLTNEPYDAVEFPFMLCSMDGTQCLLSYEEDRYPFGQIRLFRKDSGCRISPGGSVVAGADTALRRADRLFGEAVTQHIFQVGSWSGKWLNVCPRDVPMSMSDTALPTICVPANGDRLSVAVGVPSLGERKPVHPFSYAASFGFRDALASHPNVSRVDCYDGEWQGKPADNDRAYAVREDHHAFLSVDESRPAPPLPGCARMCWITTSRFGGTDITPASAASLGYDKYFVSSRRFRDEMGKLGCDAEFLIPSVSRESKRKFSRLANKCQIGMILRAIPTDWDVDNLLEAMSRLRDMRCLVFGHGWENLAAVRSGISDMPREARARLVGFLDEVVPLIGQPAATGKEGMLFSGMQCLLHIPCPQDAAWGFVPHSICGALAAGTPAVLLDENGQFDPKDLGDAPVYVEKTASQAAHKAVDIASMSFDDLEILSEKALAWASDNTHEHRAATVLSSLAVRQEDRSDRTRPPLLVCGGPLDDRTMDAIRFQSGLRGIDVVQFESDATESEGYSVEFTLGGVAIRFSSEDPVTSSQVDGIISALGH